MDELQSSGWSLVLAFPDETPSFAHGFEAGRIYERICRMNVGEDAVAEIVEITNAENRELVQRMAAVKGWAVEIAPTGTEGWDSVTFRKTGPSSKRPNPNGLRIVT